MFRLRNIGLGTDVHSGSRGETLLGDLGGGQSFQKAAAILVTEH